MPVDAWYMTSGSVWSGPAGGPMRPVIGLVGQGIVRAAQTPLPGDLGGGARAGIPVRPSGTLILSALRRKAVFDGGPKRTVMASCLRDSRTVDSGAKDRPVWLLVPRGAP